MTGKFKFGIIFIWIIKSLDCVLSVDSIANIHFFEFPQEFYTISESHSFHELIFVSSGKLSIISDSYNGILEKNNLIIHKSGEKHYLKCDKNNAPTVIIIGFTCTQPLPDQFSTTPIYLNNSDIGKLAEIIKEGRNVFAPPYDIPKHNMKKRKKQLFGSEQLLKNLLEYFLIVLMRKIYASNNNEDSMDLDTPFVGVNANEIIAYIDDNYKEHITIDELAFIFRTNRSTLCKIFKSATNKTINEYASDKRLECAKHNIQATNKTFTEIAEELNFESLQYFTKFFKKRSGLSPSEYKKLYK